MAQLRAALCAVSGCFLACEEISFVPLPDSIELEKGGIWVEGPSRKISVAETLSGALTIEGAEEILLLTYPNSVRDLGFLTATFPATDCKIMREVTVHRLSLTEGIRAFERLPALPEEWREFLLDDPDNRCAWCGEFDQRTVRVVESGIVQAGVTIGPSEMLIYVADSLHRVGRESSTPLTGCRLITESLTVSDGRVFAARQGRSLAELEIEDSRCSVLTSTVVAGVPRKDFIVTSRSPFEGLALSRAGELVRYDGTTYSLVDSIPAPADELLHPYMTWGEGGIWASLGGDTLFHGTVGALASTRVPIGEASLALNPNSISSFVEVPGLGVFVGTTIGELFVSNPDGSWTDLKSPAADRVGAVAPYRDGIVYTVEGGSVFFWHPEVGHCTPIQIPGSRNRPGRYLSVNGDDILVLGFWEDTTSPVEAVWLERTSL